MRIEMDPKEPQRIKVRYNGVEIHDQVLQPGPNVVEVEHPKTCGKAEMFFTELDGSDEFLVGTADYGQCQCTPKCS